MLLILVVKDQPEVLFILQITLDCKSYEVLVARNRKEALELLLNTSTSPDLIISDIMMPEMDGYDLFKEVSSHPRWCHVPFIFLSTRTSSEDMWSGKLLGVDDYITKPLEEDLLAIIIGELTRKEKIVKSIPETRLEMLIVKKIAEIHSVEITIESELGKWNDILRVPATCGKST
ncbi:MAG: PleD family two-component system response regulator [Candidatus Odinarchaeota archaeon]